MDIGVTISKVRKEYREYLRETHPDWADTTISTHVSDAFYLYQNTIALSFWKCFESDASMEKAKGEIFDYLKQEVMSDRADERTAQYYRDLKRLKEFIDSKGRRSRRISVMNMTAKSLSTNMLRWFMMAQWRWTLL